MNTKFSPVSGESLSKFYNALQSPYERDDLSALMGIDHSTSIKPFDFISLEFVHEMNKILNLPAGSIEAFKKLIDIINSHPELQDFAKYCHLRIFSQTGFKAGNILSPSRLIELLGTHAGMFPALLLLSGLPGTLEIYRNKGIGRQVATDTLSDLRLWMEHYYNKYDFWGLEEFKWLINHISGRLYRLGRLQYIPKRYDGACIAFRNNSTGEVAALSRPGIVYRGDGLIDGTNGIFDKKDSFEATYNECDEYFRGNPILAAGTALNEAIGLRKAEWKRVLSPGDIVLEVHIPAGEKLSSDLCGESFQFARGFFEKSFPSVNFAGFVCSSWLLDPQLQAILPSTSNILKLQREFYLYPVLSDDAQTFERVFGYTPTDYDKVVCKTSLQQAVLNFYRSGNQLHMGGMFLLKDDLHWGA